MLKRSWASGGLPPGKRTSRVQRVVQDGDPPGEQLVEVEGKLHRSRQSRRIERLRVQHQTLLLFSQRYRLLSNDSCYWLDKKPLDDVTVNVVGFSICMLLSWRQDGRGGGDRSEQKN